MSRDKVTHAQWRSPGDRLDVAGYAIVAVGGVKLGHRQQMVVKMFREIAPAQFLVARWSELVVAFDDWNEEISIAKFWPA